MERKALTGKGKAGGAGGAGAANNRKKYLSAMFGWGVKNLRKHVKMNPCRHAERVEYASEGFHTWSIEEVRRFEEYHRSAPSPVSLSRCSCSPDCAVVIW